ncbi:MAG: hypothetical protein HXX08_19140 [Chloroflexi bacterium]|uniref:Uncharacterized protein n=1 Tax=Candidatus Chlorohelix allophototropha TaxID=3003348 RepID=A0A8T7M751_9CHLR|nr:hypothetical protein [Chloroflexota bacterium]WJW69880.1 hypothetical protein OZ401_003510 [Chloroflexota bacterium L227-S17]
MLEVMVGFVVIVLLFALLDLAALKWGADKRRNGFVSGCYDPRDDWNAQS